MSLTQRAGPISGQFAVTSAQFLGMALGLLLKLRNRVPIARASDCLKKNDRTLGSLVAVTKFRPGDIGRFRQKIMMQWKAWWRLSRSAHQTVRVAEWIIKVCGPKA
jgi:hypothetical protein